jgi:hypothetical protein
MRVTFSIDIDLDTEAITREGQRHGYSLERAREAVLADIECRLSDVCRWRDGVQRVGVRIIETPVLWTTTP